MGHNLTKVLLACVVTIHPGLVKAATDGRAGPISEGSLQISLTVAPQVRVSNLQDVHLTTTGVKPLSAHSDLCIYSRTGQYQLQAYGSGNDASFILHKSGSSAEPNHWSYQIHYNDGSGLAPLTYGVPLAGLQGADTSSLTCDTTGLNGQLMITSLTKPGARLKPGQYRGTLTLLVAPE